MRSIPPGPRVFALLRLVKCLHPTSDLSCPSTPPSASLTFKPRHSLRPRSTPKPDSIAPRLSSSALQHSSDLRTLFFIPCGTSEMLLPCLSEVSPSGFGYPLGDFSPQILESIFQLSTLLGFPSRSFPLPQRSVKRFHPTSPLLRFLPKPHRPRAGASAAYSRHESRTPYAPGWIRSDRGPGSLRASDLAGFLSSLRSLWASLPKVPPLGVVSRQPLQAAFDSPSGFFPSDWLGVSHFRAPACRAFGPFSPHALFKPSTPADYFFLSRFPNLLPSSISLS